jgi:cytochrome c peroxidase
MAPVIFLLLMLPLPEEAPREPLGLLPVPWPAENSYSAAKAELGRILFFDRRLSSDGQVACATCHRPELAFTDGRDFPEGVRRLRAGDRSAPSLINRAFGRFQFWDGRVASLEEQALHPFENSREMDLPAARLVARLAEIAGYGVWFARAFGSAEVTTERVAKAIATFERTLLSGNSRYDRYIAGDRTQLSAAELRGLNLFFGRAQCSQCHSGPNFSSEEFVNTGLGVDRPPLDKGRSLVTLRQEDWGAFKVPTLREVTRTGPWMHDGRMKQLENLINFYKHGGVLNAGRDRRMLKIELSDQDRADLIAFLGALEGEGWQHARLPERFPE